ncbi:MAG: 5-dehydro-4-deoxy-D-glucuronate isomerase [candidate division KSB1 bacterium]|nr:5-dehydro-4-deoxy-D-glucuronate isomerase [candidate division KSB1 bacterium]MDZ7273539.1 5-dehydro-4-deoxy-D-glucuronate isomerase [candidate division KSB1 bacterium]MDZ7286870.1 5-dehydro-4-deoxy-D-glucuronate isomerase [candidate division KSB1 bacterium]MDZ7299777.1 5-dehydro-4-deoxy-D-glucuronate isomerase [candidate division KSB1 bacterium]MDZ7307660.1 5-dehydro-4-deoxy-D-glucuronate isomerase [candidate division KSB1 bacterium]
MKILPAIDPVRTKSLTTSELREAFLLENLFQPDSVQLVYSEIDRAVIAAAMPVRKNLLLPTCKELAADYFAQRREIGVLNIGGPGQISVDKKVFDLANRDMLYIGRGAKKIVFGSDKDTEPAAFFILSFPAHQSYPTELMRFAEADAVRLGSPEGANQRTIYKYIHPGGIESCQLVMGFTQLKSGSIWNTMPPHTHSRRMEVYLYFDVPDNARVFHFMGRPDETRHLVIANRQAVISPSWSIHCGAGTSAYAFCWGMGGENQAFEDMDAVRLEQLR